MLGCVKTKSRRKVYSCPVFMAIATRLMTSLDSGPNSVHPTILSVSASTTTLNNPFVSPKVLARGTAATGSLLTFIFNPFLRASASLSPMRGKRRVDEYRIAHRVTVGHLAFSCPEKVFAQNAVIIQRNVGKLQTALYITDSMYLGVGSLQIVVHHNSTALIHLYTCRRQIQASRIRTPAVASRMASACN